MYPKWFFIISLYFAIHFFVSLSVYLCRDDGIHQYRLLRRESHRQTLNEKKKLAVNKSGKGRQDKKKKRKKKLNKSNNMILLFLPAPPLNKTFFFLSTSLTCHQLSFWPIQCVCTFYALYIIHNCIHFHCNNIAFLSTFVGEHKLIPTLIYLILNKHYTQRWRLLQTL